MSVKVRFAPSPTGHLHIGGARTALFNYLFAKKNKGTFLVRIEDTDLARSSNESEQVIINDLKWLGINWDEGIEKGGENGPYRSTERKEIYKKYIDKLIEEEKAYYCYCTQEELEEERKKLEENNSDMLGYSGKCKNLTPDKREEYEKEGRKPTVRLRVPENITIKIDDKVRGNVEFESNGVGDFIIVKSDGIPVYNFAVTIDDYLMGITHVIRAEEHLSNTPRQILIYDALGFEKPQFAHVSLILGHDRTKMSKRHGSTWVEQYREAGYLPEAIVNFLALMGWSPETEEEFFTIDELTEQFSLDRVSKNPAVFDNEKLNWMNGQYVKNAPIERVTDLAILHLIKAGLINEDQAKSKYEWLKKVVNSVKNGLAYAGQVVEKVSVFFNDEISPENDEALEVLKGDRVLELMEVLLKKVREADAIDDEFGKGIFKIIQKETGIKGKNLFMPIRVMLTGQMHGPEMIDIIPILGRDEVIKRIEMMKEKYL
ncbi:UNVERIFIED_CONTAM: nondiscriminating glutamyl-tRNA synthetase [Acetivibrio alkalicellulosi]